MKYITYNNQTDGGAGTQTQNIFDIYLIAKQLNLRYIHSPFYSTEYNYDADILTRFNQAIAIPSDAILPTDITEITIDNLTPENMYILQQQYDTPVLFKIITSNEYIDINSYLLDPLFPYCHPWIQLDIQSVIQIAVHVRRGNVTPDVNADRFMSFLLYLECMEYLHQILTDIPHSFALYSENSIDTDLYDYQDRLNNLPLTYHIDEDVVQTFQDFVNADIFVAGYSNLSYSATTIRRKGIVIYTPYLSVYSQKHLCIHNPIDLFDHSSQILTAIGR